MKNDLLCLIEQIDYIKSFFHIVGGTGIPQLNVIYDKAEFSAWKQELQLELEGIHTELIKFPLFCPKCKTETLINMRRQMADSLEDKPFPALPEDLQCRCWFEFGSAEDHLKYRAGNAGHSAVRLQEVFRAVSEPVPGRDRNRA